MFESFWNYLALSAPYLLLGLVIAGLIQNLFSIELIQKYLGRKKITDVFYAALIGVPLPLCSCAVVPTAVGLKKKGASNAATSAFLISTPESGVDSILLTYALMDFPMTIFRPVAAFCSGSFAGLLQLLFNDKNEKTSEISQKAPKECCASSHKIEKTPLSKLVQVKRILSFAFGKLSDDIALWLFIGLLVGAMIDFLVPVNFFETLSPTTARALVLVVGIPLYICASASTPIAVAMVLKGLSPGVAFLFLLVGPAVNSSTFFVLQKYIGKRGVFLNIFAVIFVGLIFSYLIDFCYAHFFTINFKGASHPEELTLFSHICAGFLLLLIIKGIIKENIIPRYKRWSGDIEGEGGCCH